MSGRTGSTSSITASPARRACGSSGTSPKESPSSRQLRGGLRVEVRDPILERTLAIDADLLVLSAGVVAKPDGKDLAQMLKVPLNQDQFFLEAHLKLRPVDFATEGVFLCGLAHSPKNLEETIAQATAAASRATTILAKDNLCPSRPSPRSSTRTATAAPTASTRARTTP